MDVPSFVATQIPLWAAAGGGSTAGDPPWWAVTIMVAMAVAVVGVLGWVVWEAVH